MQVDQYHPLTPSCSPHSLPPMEVCLRLPRMRKKSNSSKYCTIRSFPGVTHNPTARSFGCVFLRVRMVTPGKCSRRIHFPAPSPRANFRGKLSQGSPLHLATEGAAVESTASRSPQKLRITPSKPRSTVYVGPGRHTLYPASVGSVVQICGSTDKLQFSPQLPAH